MKTTIELPDGLARQARTLAQEQGSTLRELVVEGLRAEVLRRSSPRDPDPPFRLRTVSGEGLRHDVDPSTLTDRAYGPPT